jgi:hypothetical protein
MLCRVLPKSLEIVWLQRLHPISHMLFFVALIRIRCDAMEKRDSALYATVQAQIRDFDLLPKVSHQFRASSGPPLLSGSQ